MGDADTKTPQGKSLPEYFRDWESYAFGFGYGTGEQHIIPALRTFMETVAADGLYDYRDLEFALGPLPAWLLINALAGDVGAIIEYGTSPRFGWLTEGGKKLREFILSHTDDQLYEFTFCTGDDVICYPDACNCGPKGYEKDRICANPFWGR